MKLEMARLLVEAAHLLTVTAEPRSCPNWVYGKGDCGEPDCMFCRINKCIERLLDKSEELKEEVKAELGWR